MKKKRKPRRKVERSTAVRAGQRIELATLLRDETR
jgi:hypothetical protein